MQRSTQTRRRLLAALAVVVAAAAAPFAGAAERQASAASPAPGRAEVLIGLIPEVNIFKQKARFTLLGEYLTRKAGVPVRFTILPRYGGALEGFDAERMDGAFLGSFTGAVAIERLGAIPLARPVNHDGTSAYHGYLFVRKDAGIHSPEAMRGKRMAYVDRATSAGYVFPLAWLRERGIHAEHGFFGETWFAGSHDAAIQAVLDRKADVGVAKDTVYDRVRRENPRVDQELLILASSPPMPSNALCVRRELDEKLRDSLRRALLDLAADPDGPRVLEQFGALRFVEAARSDYAPVADLARKAGIDVGRYQERDELAPPDRR
jgi:phosphonate transport system substrate-binding protein